MIKLTILSEHELKDLVNCAPDNGLVIAKPYRFLKTWHNPQILHIDVYRYDEHRDGDSIENWLVHAVNGRIEDYEQVRGNEDVIIDRWTVARLKAEMIN